VQEAAVQAIPWVEKLARFGYAAKGVVYAVVGLLALQLAFGRTLLAIMAVGLLAYALWRFVQAAADPEHKGKDAKGLAQRGGYVVSGLTYGGQLGYYARGVVYAIIGGFFLTAALRFDPNQAGGFGQALAELARQPYGPWLLALVALGVFCYGIYSFVQARYRRIFAR
jgi:hypothetical protein